MDTIKNSGELGCYGRASSSCSKCHTRRTRVIQGNDKGPVNVVINIKQTERNYVSVNRSRVMYETDTE
jgi:C4-type Zn-finger protein